MASASWRSAVWGSTSVITADIGQKWVGHNAVWTLCRGGEKRPDASGRLPHVIDDGRIRCWPVRDEVGRAYHDEEWGRPVRDEVRLFEKICLEAFQSGLSWDTILRKRAAFRAAFAGFDPEAVARFGAADVARLLAVAGIVRNRAKIDATIANARAVAELH